MFYRRSKLQKQHTPTIQHVRTTAEDTTADRYDNVPTKGSRDPIAFDNKAYVTSEQSIIPSHAKPSSSNEEDVGPVYEPIEEEDDGIYEKPAAVTTNESSVYAKLNARKDTN